MTKGEQARQRLVEIALSASALTNWYVDALACDARRRADYRDPYKGPWCAAGLTAAMEDAGLLVPDPGRPARRGAIALLDFVTQDRAGGLCHYPIEKQIELAQPGDIIAWLQHPQGDVCTNCGGSRKVWMDTAYARVPVLDCSVCEDDDDHVAVIVAVDGESITTVGWNEGPKPGRVMKRRLWRQAFMPCEKCLKVAPEHRGCSHCKFLGRTNLASTVLWRRPGGIYGIARPVGR